MELTSGCRCLVTGGAGFIGSHLVEELLKLGCEVICVDNYSSGKKTNIKPFKKNPLFTEIESSILNKALMDEVIEGVDVIFNQAASKKNICLKDPHMDLDVNAGGTLLLMQLAKKHGVKKFVHASTGSVYGEALFFPQTEGHPLNPCSYYGVSKLAGEKYTQLFDIDTTVLRYFHVYGARQDDSPLGGVVAIFIKKLKEGKPIEIFGDGNQQRSFTFVKDVVRANILACRHRGIYNCASGIAVTINELAVMLAGIMNKKLEVIYKGETEGDIRYFEIDNTKIKDTFNMTFETDLVKGLEKTIWT